MDTRERILASTRELLWERGYGATSPRAVMDASGAGQGSLYHFFPNKPALGRAAIEASAQEALEQARRDLLAEGVGPRDRVRAFLLRERAALRGCPVGRLAADVEVRDDPNLRAPVAEYFRELRTLLEHELHAAAAAGELPAHADPGELAVTVMAVVQGAYVVAQGTGDAAAYDAAVSGALDALLGPAPGAGGGGDAGSAVGRKL